MSNKTDLVKKKLLCLGYAICFLGHRLQKAGFDPKWANNLLRKFAWCGGVGVGWGFVFDLKPSPRLFQVLLAAVLSGKAFGSTVNAF